MTLRSVLIALGLIFLSVLWIRQVELIRFTCQITESIPPIPALAALLLFAVLTPLLRRLGPRFCLSRGELGILFVMVGIGSVMSAVGVVQAFLPYLTVPFYFAAPENKLGQIASFLPDWLGPRDPESIRCFFEGAENGLVPWGEWLPPLGWWLLFFLAFWITATCLWTILRRQWVENERLTFSLLYIPLHLTEEVGGPTASSRGRSFFRNPLMWIGFGIAFFYNLFNILHAFNPGVACLGVFFPIGSLFTEKPLNALSGLQMWHRPELVGLGYLVSQEVLFSVWAFYLLQRFSTVVATAFGWEKAGFPFEAEQGMGAYLVMAFFLLWVARRQIGQAWRQAISRTPLSSPAAAPQGKGEAEPLPYRVALIGLGLGFSGLVFFAWRAGMAGRVALFFFSLLFLFALTYARIRAETGTPSVWALPHSQLLYFPFYTFGSKVFEVGGSFQTMSVWTSFFFLVHGGFFNQTTVYQLESFKLADELRLPRWQMVVAGLLALLVGLVMAYWMFLTTYYDYGANVLAGGAESLVGGVRIDYCRGAYDATGSYLTAPKLPDVPRNLAAGLGALVTAAVIACRVFFLRFPFHPLGYIMASVIGSQLWWAFLVAWVLKSTLLRLGGVRLYQRLIPAFLGLALGHFFTAGILWGSLANLWPHVAHIVWFT